ncbi:MAG: hypothetical protein DHS20C18_46590 [Saprospiraceae bacterium]|nr:MAG: hypothetical protein DHS20C18_46590 [Saprospiraceae bacterium]
MKIKNFLFVLFFALYLGSGYAQNRYATETGNIWFQSDAPLEVIEARSGAMRGIVDVDKNAFAFTVNIRSFEGFNSPLQKEHFNENYMESKRFSRAIFSGKIIEKVDLNKDGSYEVRAKGKLIIHGIEQERIIKGQLKVAGDEMQLETEFTVLLEEHNIEIPKIVFQKIAEEIRVKIKAKLVK